MYVCVGVDGGVPGRYCEGACPFLGSAEWEALGDWWMLRKVWSVLGEHLGDREAVEALLEVEAGVVGGIGAIEVVG